MPLVDKLTEEAHATGAVNTITREGKRLVGHNTDVPGFKVALDKLVGRQKMPRTAVVLGAGGGARAVVYGLIREGFQRIVVFNRHLHRAEAMVKHFGRSAAHMELRAMPWHESIIESELAKTKVLVNATSIGLTADETPIPAEILPPELLVLDLIYNRTRLLRDAEAAGCTVADGELMLLHQGAAAFTLWTGQPAPLELMQRKLLSRGARSARASRSAEGEPAGASRRADGGRAGTRRSATERPADADRPDGGPAALADRRRIARPDARRHARGRARRACRLGRAPRGRPRPPPARLRPRRAPGDRARPGRDRRRRPPRPDARLADPPPGREPRLGELDAGHAGRGRSPRTRPRSSRRSADDGNKKATPVTRVRPGHADLAGALKYGFNDVRNVLERASARETAARVAAGGVARAFLARARRRGLVVHRRGRRGRARSRARDALARGGGRVAAALPGSGRRGAR